jgi:pteridine reductase
LNYTSKCSDKVALVTGASRRIGAAIARLLHEKGFRVALHCHLSLMEARSLADSLNQIRKDSAAVFQADLSAPEVCGKLMTSVMAWSTRLDVLVNNASLFLKSECQEFKSRDWQDLFALNVQAPFELSCAAFPLLACHNGSIINIIDIHAEKPLKGYSVYCQTKAALLMQTRSLAREFAPKVRVNAVAPGAIAWPEHDNALDEKIQQKIIAKTPLKCHGEPKQIAQAVVALLDNTFITGQVLNVDGGRSIG